MGLDCSILTTALLKNHTFIQILETASNTGLQSIPSQFLQPTCLLFVPRLNGNTEIIQYFIIFLKNKYDTHENKLN